MAIYHLSVTHIRRSKGRSATAAAAYRASEKITDLRTDKVHDYTKKSGVLHTEIITPNGESISRDKLWNLAEIAEKRRDGTPAREYNIALPVELSETERLQLTRNFANFLVKEQGCAVDIAIHAPSQGGDKRNYHAHILCTTRKYMKGQELGEKCDIELSGRDRAKKKLPSFKTELEKTRQKWAELANTALNKSNILLDHISQKSLAAQGINRPATKHLGPAATAMERRGIESDKGTINRQIKELKAVNKEIAEVEKLLTTAPKTMEQKVVNAYKAWVESENKNDEIIKAQRQSDPIPEPKPQTAPAKSLEEQINDYLKELDRQIEQKQYLTRQAYENNENTIKEAAKPETDFYDKTRWKVGGDIQEERFSAYLAKVKAESNEKIALYKQKLQYLENNKPKSFFKGQRHQSNLSQWQMTKEKYEREKNWHEQRLKEDFYQHEQAKRDFNPTKEEVEQRINETLTPEARQRFEKAKIIKNLVEQASTKSTKLKTHVRQLEKQAQSLSKSKGRGGR